MGKKELQSLQKTVGVVMKGLPARNRDVITRRFGLQNGKRETLESIGKSYGITRERVRQIEEFTLAHLTRQSEESRDVHKYVSQIRAILHKEGGVMREGDLFERFSGTAQYTAANASLVFLLSLGTDVVRFDENDHFNSFWAVSDQHLEAAKTTVKTLTAAFEKHKQVVPESELHDFASRNGINSVNNVPLADSHLAVFRTISRDLETNIFGQVGLVHWPEVRPKGVRDKAYLIMKREKEPRHFRAIAGLINKAGFDSKKVNVQTVHNELIKDDRFVLVGRGLYALSEWGYKAGTVKDVLIDILRESPASLTKADLVAKVMNARMVKENTIVLNLQDSSRFVRNPDGTYDLREA